MMVRRTDCFGSGALQTILSPACSIAMKLIVSIAVCLAVGLGAGMFTSANINSWYVFLHKPPLNPPNWLFAPVWTLLYILMGIASWLIWRLQPSDKRNNTLLWFALQLVLNFLWSFIFFGAHAIGWALADIVLLWIVLWVCLRRFKQLNATAGWLFVPYLLWVSFAVYLNTAILVLN